VNRRNKKGPMCWLCNGPLTHQGKVIYALVSLPNKAEVKVHKVCVKDAKKLVEQPCSWEEPN